MTQTENLVRFWRYATTYGVRRTLYKAVGRRRSSVAAKILSPGPCAVRDIGVIGCGQFAFATIGPLVVSRLGNRFAGCFDTDYEAARSFAKFYRLGSPARSVADVIDDPDIRVVYVASNHASHSDYAIQALAAGKVVHVEKPVATTQQQLARLVGAAKRHRGRVFAGYNRPFAPAISALRQWSDAVAGPLTLSCLVSGHLIGADHWYRRPDEGTRILGNVGHWLDLMVHILSWGQLPERWAISLTWADDSAPDDNLTICLVSARGDLVTIVLSARSEPFEGINETISVQWGDLIAKIDDFRWMRMWKGARTRSLRFFPKDVGHESAILQAFRPLERQWAEVELSSLLMLAIARMVEDRVRFADFTFSGERERLVEDKAPQPPRMSESLSAA